MATTAAASASSAAMQETKARACPVIRSHLALVGRSSSFGFTSIRTRWEPPLAVRHAPDLQLAIFASAAPLSLYRSRRHGIPTSSSYTDRLVEVAAMLGGFYAMTCFVYGLGSQALPLSTSLLLATQLAFTGITDSPSCLWGSASPHPRSANAVVLLTIGLTVLGSLLGPSFMKPAGHSSKAYRTGQGSARPSPLRCSPGWCFPLSRSPRLNTTIAPAPPRGCPYPTQT
uniref:Uncharacterized protein n=1 Tax=Oryza brachyantha TaxID=4533 RepID=J3L0D5_ORYBR